MYIINSTIEPELKSDLLRGLEPSNKFKSYFNKEIQHTVLTGEKIRIVMQSIDKPDMRMPSLYPKLLHKCFENKSIPVYKKMLTAIGINREDISVDGYIKLYYYYIEKKANIDEIIAGCARVCM